MAEKGLASTYHPFKDEEKEGKQEIIVIINDKGEAVHNGKKESNHGHVDNNLFVDKKAAYIDLFDEKYKKSPGPLMDKCECYTCKNHSKAYIHHLLNCNEMTGFVLLVIHDLHVYNKLFDKLTKLINNHDKIKLKNYIIWFLDTQTNK